MSKVALRRVGLCAVVLCVVRLAAGDEAVPLARQVGVERGLCVVVNDARCGEAIRLAKATSLTLLVELSAAEEVAAARAAADEAGLLGSRIAVAQTDGTRLHLADNLADAVVVLDGAAKVGEAEALRVLRPGGKAFVAGREAVKAEPPGLDGWSHPYHGPDNNTQSRDQVARAPYLTQFVADPAFGCMPEVTVASGGRVFRAFGHIAFREYQNAALNTLTAVNAYNGTMLWKRDLPAGFMIHRNTLIATPDTLFLADDKSCKMLDAATGQVRDEIVAPADVSDGPVWKWMALDGGVLYALVGATEFKPPTQKGRDRILSGWPWAMWPGFNYADPKTAYGFGRTFVAFDVKTKRVVWSHKQDDYIDSRGTCMGNGRIYFFCPGKSLNALDVKTGESAWSRTDADLLAAIGPNGAAQGFRTGFASSTYIKCSEKGIFFAGPQRPNVAAASADTGKLLWKRADGNMQIVLRADAIYAAGGQGQKSFKLDYATGNVLAQFTDRRACTRATGSVDSVFYRAKEGTVRMVPETGKTEHIAPMRPPCHSGVIVSEGLLHWGPWICGCRLSLFGHIAVAPAGGFDFHPKADETRLVVESRLFVQMEEVEVLADGLNKSDWPAYRAMPNTEVAVPADVRVRWTYKPSTPGTVAPAVAAGDLVFIGGEDGSVRALNAADGSVRWTTRTGAAIKSSPAFSNGRLFAGSCDGWVYALEARTGKVLWRFRLAPAERWMPVFGRLQSTWPVAGGVAVSGGALYEAAGFTHYDGTYVAALDAVTGKLKWYNDSSGSISKVKNGITLAGPLYVEGGELRFAGGDVYAVARYDLKTGRCLNEPVDTETSDTRTLFYNPDSFIVRATATFGGGRSAVADNNSGRLTLTPAPAKPAGGFFTLNRALALAGDTLLVAGAKTSAVDPVGEPGVAAVNFKDGSTVWRAPLPAVPVESGMIVTRGGDVVVSLRDGRVVCLGAK